MDKKAFRKNMLLKRDEISSEIRKGKSGIIENKVLNSEPYKNASKILIYLNMRSEVITEGIINISLKKGKKVGLPITFNENRKMIFIEIDSLEHLTKTKIGTMEPIYNEDKIIVPDENTLVIVPGCGFDENLFRMGYGGGFYDTFIEKYPMAKYMAIAYEEQMIPSVPREEHDKKLDYIITDRRELSWNI